MPVPNDIENKLITINIPLSLYKELEQQPNINRSEVCRDALKAKLRGGEIKASPRDKFYFVFSLCMAFTLIVLAVTERDISTIFLILMGLFIGIFSARYYIKDIGVFK